MRRHLLALPLVLGAVVLGATAAPASATTTTQTASCVDGGGVRWNAKAVWGDTYVASGVTKATIDYAGWTTTRAGTVSTDSAVRTYDGAGTLLQTLTWTGGFAYQSGAAFKVRNPVNPPSAPGKAKVTISLGVDGDGFGSCVVTFTQPAAAPTTPPPTTPPPTTPPPTTPPAGSPSDTYESTVITATNRERTAQILVTLTAQACVDSYAESQAAAMVAQNRMFHQDLGPILTNCHLSAVGENVAYGYPDGQAVTTAW
ncbi:MAG: hypothetical protein ABWY56_14665, partial [Propionibacteriaceae bacterium]